MNTECIVCLLYFISEACTLNAIRLKLKQIKEAKRAEELREQALILGTLSKLPHSVGM